MLHLCTLLVLLLLFGGFAGAAKPLAIDKETGQYRDLSYKALTDEGLSWEEHTRLFGGTTVHYGELTDEQRRATQRELAALLKKIDRPLVARCSREISQWLDQQAQDLPTAYTGRDTHKIKAGAVLFLRAYEIFGEPEYLAAGLACADLILKAQWPRGHWPWPGKNEN
ncbi:MAG: hypothetical protein VX346_06210, partial [Planctomycetota bacterium]|nr:hypothetical protein [Planctomycetota bacterium]